MAADRPRIGITMRQTVAPGSGEVRDALARDWSRLFEAALPEACWLPIPNLGAAAVDFCRNWQLNGLILSGGDDIGATLERDATEQALIASFAGDGRPVLGICRGLQMLWTRAGGTLQKTAGHAGTRHPVTLVEPAWQKATGAEMVDANSYHANVLTGPLPDGWRTAATDPAGRPEAIVHVELPMAGLMWHPEREPTPARLDRMILRSLFLNRRNVP